MDVNVFVYSKTKVQAGVRYRYEDRDATTGRYIVLTIDEGLTIFINEGAEKAIIEALRAPEER